LGHLQVGVECYGGGLWHTWFDRDLSLAGRVLIKQCDGTYVHNLVKIDRPILRIPTLAIHLDRSVNDSFTFNKEVQLTPILALSAEKELNKSVIPKDASATNNFASENHHTVLLDILAKEMGVAVDSIQDFELCLFDTQPASIGGANNEFIHSARLDNLMMSFCGVEALLNSCRNTCNDHQVRVLALFDNEEVGSNTAHGADSNILEVTLKRISSILSSVEVCFL
jgi:aspartyl aminopeptidase